VPYETEKKIENFEFVRKEEPERTFEVFAFAGDKPPYATKWEVRKEAKNQRN